MTEIFYASDHVLLSMGYNCPEEHRHLAKHIIVGCGSDFIFNVNGIYIQCCGICIGSDVPHTVLKASSGLVFLFDETCSLSKQLEGLYLKGKPFSTLNRNLCDRVVKEWGRNRLNAAEFDRRILTACGLNKNDKINYDRRVAKLLESIHKAENISSGTFKKLCCAAGLSQSRLSHLFKEQTGVSLGSYLVFEKIRKTFRYLESGENITDACIHAGFDSSSHFSSTYKRFFGSPLRKILNSNIIIRDVL